MKENKIEKLILNLSTRWDCSPQEAVDRLNSMNESEINKLINSMTKKFQMGGSLEDRVAFGTTERPRKFNPAEINPISKRKAMQKYAGFGYDRGQLKRIYKRAAEYLGKENAAKWMSATWDQRTPGQTGYSVPTEGQNTIWRNAPTMQSGPEMPVTNSDPQYFNGPRNFKFENSVKKHDLGGIMDFFKSLFPTYKQERVLWKNPKTKNNARTGYIKETLKTGNDSIIRMVGKPVHDPDTTMIDKNGNLYSSPYSENPTWPTLSVEQWNKANNKMDKAKEKSYGFKQGGLIDCLRAGGNLTECKKCGGKANIRKGALGIDDLPNDYTTQTMEGSTRVTKRNRRNRNESVTTTEQRIRNFGTPQADTVWFKYQNNTPLMDRYQRSRTYYTPTDYNKRGVKGWFRRFFSNEATPDMIRMQDGGEMEPIPELQYGEYPIWVRDANENRIQHKIGTIRNVGGVKEFNPTIIGEQLGLPTVGEGNTGTYESRQEYLNRWKAFQEKLASENKVK